MQEEILCEKCRKIKAVNVCLGCHAAICQGCARYELFGSGCGCVYPAHYCPSCADDPRRNPNAIPSDPAD